VACQPEHVLSWVHILEWRAAVSPDAVALTDDRGGELTYSGLAAAMEWEAARYAAAGVRPGDVVPVIARNQVGWVTAMFGLVRVGALPAAVNWRLAAPEVMALLDLMRPAALVSDADCAALAKQALASLAGAEPALLGLGEPAAPGEEAGSVGAGAGIPPRPVPGSAGPGAETPPRPVERLRGPEPLILLHTSGTTGRPKLVPLTHQMLVAADVFMKLEVPEATVGTRHLSALPLFHVAGLANLGYALFTGGHLHVLGGFEPAGFVDELANRQIQLTQLVPTLIQAVTDEVSSRAQPPDLSHLIEIVYGASPIRPDLLERAVRTLGCRFRAPLPGYWNDAAATGRAMTADGFYRTGDVGVIDGDGYLTIVDRLNDVVITGGENVYPAEVEAVLASHPQVADVAVIAVPDDRWGETVHAVVVAGPGPDGLDTAKLIDWAHQRLAGFKCPTGVSVVAQLPRNATGKVLRSALREPFWAGRDRRVS